MGKNLGERITNDSSNPLSCTTTTPKKHNSPSPKNDKVEKNNVTDVSKAMVRRENNGVGRRKRRETQRWKEAREEAEFRIKIRSSRSSSRLSSEVSDEISKNDDDGGEKKKEMNSTTPIRRQSLHRQCHGKGFLSPSSPSSYSIKKKLKEVGGKKKVKLNNKRAGKKKVGEEIINKNAVKNENEEKNGDDMESYSVDLNAFVCCLCGCGTDFSDMDDFSWPDEKKEHKKGRKNEKILSEYDGSGNTCDMSNVGNNNDLHNNAYDSSKNKDDNDNNVSNNILDINYISNDRIDMVDKSTKVTNIPLLSSSSPSQSESPTVLDAPPHANHTIPTTINTSTITTLEKPPGPKFHDPHNAIVICDGDECGRSYHQRCHFVPILTVPRGKWICLICQFRAKLNPECNYKVGKRNKGNRKKIKGGHKCNRLDIGSNVTTSKKEDELSPNEGNDDILLESLRCPLTLSELCEVYPPPASAKTTTKSRAKIVGTNTVTNEMVGASIQERFEFQSSGIKMIILSETLERAGYRTVDSNLSRIRTCQNAIRCYTETDRARKTVLDRYDDSSSAGDGRCCLPQEFVQNVMGMGRCKVYIRGMLGSLGKIVRNINDITNLREWQTSMVGLIPESSIGSDARVAAGMVGRVGPRFAIEDYDGDEENNDDVDNNSNTKIKCAVCFSGHTSNGNDVLMCDGKQCFRAMHMKCVDPPISQEMLDNDYEGTWFCPYCVLYANLVHYVQVEYMGDEWDERLKLKAGKVKNEDIGKEKKECTMNKNCNRVNGGLNREGDIINCKYILDDENSSTSSWSKDGDVFKEGDYELRVAEKWKIGLRDEEADEALGSLLGLTIVTMDDEQNDGDSEDTDYIVETIANSNNNAEFSSDSGSSEALDNEGNMNWEIDKSEVGELSIISTTSLSPSLVMDKIELDEDGKELFLSSKVNHIRDGERKDDCNSRTIETSVNNRRKSSRKKVYSKIDDGLSQNFAVQSDDMKDKSKKKNLIYISTMDESNILRGKRKRTKVDYRRLNDAMFGELDPYDVESALGNEDDEYDEGIINKNNKNKQKHKHKQKHKRKLRQKQKHKNVE